MKPVATLGRPVPAGTLPYAARKAHPEYDDMTTRLYEERFSRMVHASKKYGRGALLRDARARACSCP